MFLESTAQVERPYDLTGDFLAGRLRKHLDQDELACVEGLVAHERMLSDQEVLARRAERVDTASILIEGLMFRTIESGNQRFIVGLHVPGDFVDLHGFALGRLDHSIVSVGTARVGVVPHLGIERLMQKRPSLARILWFASLLDAAIHRQWIQMLEQLDAPRRIAHIYCELQTRLELVGKPSTRALRAPFTQYDLADMCGISAVHANRAIGRLRELGLAQIRRGTLYTSDWAALRQYARFDSAYLYADTPFKLAEMRS